MKDSEQVNLPLVFLKYFEDVWNVNFNFIVEIHVVLSVFLLYHFDGH